MSSDVVLPGKTTRPHYRHISGFFGPAFLRSTGGFHVIGHEQVPAGGPVLICPNHMSYLDPPLLAFGAKRRRCFMAKRSLFDVPLLGSFLRVSYCYPVDREEGGRQAIRIATNLLEAGEVVVIFPEGTRSPDGELLPGRPGPAFIASRVNAPVVPAALWGTDVVLPRHSKRLYRCPIYLKYGAPMMPPQAEGSTRVTKGELQEFTDELMARIAILKSELIAQVPQHWLERAERLKSHWRSLHPGEAEEMRKQIEQGE